MSDGWITTKKAIRDKLMKHLKKFNESSNEYYQSVDYNDWVDAIFSKSVTFEQKYVDDIKNRLKTGYRINQSGNFIEIVYDRWSNYEIGQAQDEWFFLRKEVQDIMSGPYNESYVYYKCDQLEGLLKFLKDYNVIK